MTHPTDFGFESCKETYPTLTLEQFNKWRGQYLAAQLVDANKYMSASDIACQNRLNELVEDANRIVSACENRGIEAKVSTNKNAAGASVYVTFDCYNIRLSDHDCQRAGGVYVKFFYPCTEQVKDFISTI